MTPNLMIVPNQVSLYMSLAPEEKLSYKEGGDKALAQFESGVQGFLAASFRGCGVVTSDPFEVSDGVLPTVSTLSCSLALPACAIPTLM